jgi:hypothetical protein
MDGNCCYPSGGGKKKHLLYPHFEKGQCGVQTKATCTEYTCCLGKIPSFDGTNSDLAYNAGYCCFAAGEGKKKTRVVHFEEGPCPQNTPVSTPSVEELKNKANITLNVGKASIPISTQRDETFTTSPFFGATQNLNVITETGTKLPVVIHYSDQVPEKILVSPTPTSLGGQTSKVVSKLVSAKIKCITINKIKLTMNCMASMVSSMATIFGYGQPEPYCFNDSYKSSQITSIAGTITLDGKDTQFMVVPKSTNDALTEIDKKNGLLSVQKTIEGSGFWLNVEGNNMYQNQPLFKTEGTQVNANDEVMLDTNISNNTFYMFLGVNSIGKSMYARYTLAPDTDPNKTTNGSCTLENTLN